ncbi:glycosyltransferase family 2 protein [Paenibacillus sp. FSL H7-0756]|uniref:glycosyltransferase family 2 protein n=1 Tax=Paenibacillus sp. FSL H7-0756 TaxID=2954738 RepID=UPI0030FA9C39
MPLLSIIIPVFNAEQYIEECLESILNQAFSDYEIILIDDASKDNSGHICDAYAAQYEQIEVIHLEVNSLPAVARNIGLNMSKGKYVHFCDNDDYYIDGIFSHIADKLRDCAPSVLMGQFISIPEKGAFITKDVPLNPEVFIQSDSSQMSEYLLTIPNLLCTPWKIIVNRELLISNNITFPEGYHSEDEEWFPKVICCANTFALLEEPFYCYRPRAMGSITSTKSYLHSKSHLVVAFHLLRFLNEKKFEDARSEFLYSRIDFLLGLFSTRCSTFLREELREIAMIIQSNMDIFPLIAELSRRQSLHELVRGYGAYIGICLYRTYVIETTVELLHGKGNREIYVFPTGYNGEGTAKILQNAGYDVKGFIDNSEKKEGCIINGLPVSLPYILKRMPPESLSSIFVIVSVQSDSVANSIINQLRELGLHDSQFSSKIY